MIEERDIEQLEQDLACGCRGNNVTAYVMVRSDVLKKVISLLQSYLKIRGLLPEKRNSCKDCKAAFCCECKKSFVDKARNQTIDEINLSLLKNFPSYAREMGYVKVEELSSEEVIWNLFSKQFGCKPDKEDCSFGKCDTYIRCSLLAKAILKLFKR